MISQKIKDIIENYKFERFMDIEAEFSHENNKLFDINKYAQIGLMHYSLANFYPLFKDIIDTIKPTTICEIGVDTGFTTYLLNDICVTNNGRLHAIDPCIDEENPPIKSAKITYFKEKSKTYLDKKIHNDVYFIDGEHTYDSVYSELSTIHQNNTSTSKHSVVFLHDMSWPHSYRDVVYDKDEYPFKNRNTGKGFLFPTTSKFTDYGMPMFYTDVVDYEGGEKNGLLKAVQDFLEKHKDYDFCRVPSIYGFGILWHKKDKKDIVQILNEKKKVFEQVKSFLGYLEFHRFLLVSKIESLQQINNADQYEKANLQDTNQNLENEKTNLNETINTLNAEKTQLQEANQNLENEKINLHETINILNAEKTQLQEANQNLENEKTNLNEIINTLNAEKTQLQEANQNLENEKANLQEINQNLENEKINLQDAANALNAEKINLQNELNNLLNSKSWKLTFPLRTFSNIFKRI